MNIVGNTRSLCSYSAWVELHYFLFYNVNKVNLNYKHKHFPVYYIFPLPLNSSLSSLVSWNALWQLVMGVASGRPNGIISRDQTDILSDIGVCCGSVTADMASCVLIYWWKLYAARPFLLIRFRKMLYCGTAYSEMWQRFLQCVKKFEWIRRAP
jgi:hypothetical protein